MSMGAPGKDTPASPTHDPIQIIGIGSKENIAKSPRQKKTLSPARPPTEPTIATVPIGPGPSLGQADAPVVMVEFTDYQCPYCKQFDTTVMAELTKNFVDTGKLRILSRNLPLSFHPNAEPAAIAALSA